MKAIFTLFFLGIVQGLTEFLPVSSSGHLVLFSALFGVSDGLFVSILLHVATLLSILVVFRKDVWQMVTHPLSDATLAIVIATIPTCVIVLVLMPLIEASFSGGALALCFLISAALLAISQFCSRKACRPFSKKTAFFMGVAQGFAVFPGISRSGATISAGILSGAERGECAKFSFLMSIPVILLSMVKEIFEVCSGAVVVSVSFFPAALAFLSAFACGIFAIKVMIKLTEKANFVWFSVYLLAISIVSFFLI